MGKNNVELLLPIDFNIQSKDAISKEYLIQDPLSVYLTNEKDFFDVASLCSLAVSIAAALITAWGITRNAKLLRQARKHAIQDGFWIQQFVFPKLINPLHDFLLQTIITLPPETISSKRQINQFYNKYQKDHTEWAAQLGLLDLISSKIHKYFSDEFYSIEDAVAEYTYLLTSSSDLNKKSAARQKTIAAIREFSNELLLQLKKHQEAL